MFPSRYFPARYFPLLYFPRGINVTAAGDYGGTVVIVGAFGASPFSRPAARANVEVTSALEAHR